MKEKTLYTEIASFTKECLPLDGTHKEYIARNMAISIVRNMNIDDLKKLFDFHQINPTLVEAKALSELPSRDTVVYKMQIYV